MSKQSLQEIFSLTLTEDRLRALVAQSSLPCGKFIDAMAPVFYGVREGKKSYRRLNNKSFDSIVESIERAAASGDTRGARNTALFSMVFAYQNTCDHLADVLEYVNSRCRSLL